MFFTKKIGFTKKKKKPQKILVSPKNFFPIFKKLFSPINFSHQKKYKFLQTTFNPFFIKKLVCLKKYLYHQNMFFFFFTLKKKYFSTKNFLHPKHCLPKKSFFAHWLFPPTTFFTNKLVYPQNLFTHRLF